jgi:hypothetical protein
LRRQRDAHQRDKNDEKPIQAMTNSLHGQPFQDAPEYWMRGSGYSDAETQSPRSRRNSLISQPNACGAIPQ